MKSINPNSCGSENFEAVSVGNSPCVLTDECQKIEIADLLRKARLELKKKLVQSQLQIEGIQAKLTTSKAGFGGNRIWFDKDRSFFKLR